MPGRSFGLRDGGAASCAAESSLSTNHRGTPVAAAVAAQRFTKDLRDIWKGLCIVLFNPHNSSESSPNIGVLRLAQPY